MTTGSDERIAIVGMAGRFPGARNTQELWDLLKNGAEARVTIADEALRNAGVPAALLQNPKYVKACMKLEDSEFFDAEFFDYSPKQAASIDPQQRLFLECAWEALESAGYGGAVDGISTGVFGGSGLNGYLFENLLRARGLD